LVTIQFSDPKKASVMKRGVVMIIPVFALLPCMAQLSVNTAMTPAQLVQNVLVGAGVTVSNITYSGGSTSIGSFTTGSSNLGLAAGVVLSTGDVSTIGGASNTDVGIGDGTNSDNDLMVLSGQSINNAAILEFDFVPNGDSLKFKFVFGSEEYPTYVCSSFNDAFGFFLSGPGLSGPFSNNAINVALVPNTTVPITINTINSGVAGSAGSPATCAAADPNWQNNSVYYVNNGSGTTVAFNGFTTVLTALAAVECGQTYHIKLAIGNGTDSALQSGVFLEAGSFQSNALPDLTASTLYGDGTAAEGCQGGHYTIYRPAGEDSTYTVHYYFTGTATPGVDFQAPPSPLVIPAGQDSVNLPFSAIDDGITEGMESAILNVFVINACGDTLVNSVVLAIVDYPPMQINTQTTVLLQCDHDSVPLFAHVTGGFGQVNMLWGDTLAAGQVYVPGMENGTYTITATDECPKTVSQTITVDAGCKIIIPNVITPNGDGQNDKFVVEGIKGRENRVQIWDRWGKEVLNTVNYQNNFSANDLHDGVYFYAIKVKDQQYTGNLQVLGSK
jgi:gliding motility-associated-like protein